jgi:hypothetical protein
MALTGKTHSSGEGISTGPFSCLPVEVVAEVMKYLTAHHRLFCGDILNRKWQAAITCYWEINISEMVKRGQLLLSFNRATKPLFTQLWKISPIIRQAIELLVLDCSSANKGDLWWMVQPERQPFEQCNSFDCLGGTGFLLPNLRVLHLKQADRLTDKDVKPVFNGFPALHHLILDQAKLTGNGLSDIGFLTKLTSLEFLSNHFVSSKGIANLTALCNLERLNLRGCFNVSDRGVVALSSILTLRCLDLSMCTRLTDASVCKVAKLPKLTSLDVSGCDRLTDRTFAALAQSNTLEVLHLDDCSFVTDTTLKMFEKTKRLRQLSARSLRAVPDVGVRSLLSSKSLLRIAVDGCQQVSSHLVQLTGRRASVWGWLNQIDHGISHHPERCSELPHPQEIKTSRATDEGLLLRLADECTWVEESTSRSHCSRGIDLSWK